jgi:hypothetical protein
MKKMSLKVEELAVESFETTRQNAQRGTVAAHDSGTGHYWCTEWWSCITTCNSCNCTGGVSCNGGCTEVDCGTADGTCEWTAPNPVGTCCGLGC